jgi:hypothetical protein
MINKQTKNLFFIDQVSPGNEKPMGRFPGKPLPLPCQDKALKINK